MDNLLSSVRLFGDLSKGKIACTGTIRSETTGSPLNLKVRDGADKTMQWDTLGIVVINISRENVLALFWIGNGAVQMLTTGENDGLEHTAVKKRKWPRQTSTNGAKVRQVFGNESTKALEIPVVIDL